MHLRWGTHREEVMRQTFRARSLEKEVRVIKISAVALTQETDCECQIQLGSHGKPPQGATDSQSGLGL